MLTLEHLASLIEAHPDAARARVETFDIGGRPFDFNTAPAVMGVVNLSADSWYRETVCLDVDSAVRLGRTQAAQGAAIIDLGAESTLANAARISGPLAPRTPFAVSPPPVSPWHFAQCVSYNACP